jgi:hypothetical protein
MVSEPAAMSLNPESTIHSSIKSSMCCVSLVEEEYEPTREC